MSGCGVLTKGSHPKDDLVPCGTKVWFVIDKKTVQESMHLCLKCKGEK